MTPTRLHLGAAALVMAGCLAAAGTVALAMAPLQGAARVGTPNPATGVVSGSVESSPTPLRPLTYAAPATTGTGGTVVVSATGAFTYTPSATARHAAAKTGSGTPTTDSFTVTVSDGYGGTAAVPVTVPIAPANAKPVVLPRLRKVTGVSGSTGVVTGRVAARDPDGDPLSYQAARPPAKGVVRVSPSTGGFTYTPTAAARRAAAAAPGAGSPARSDSFTVTITDGYGGAVRVPVRVPVR